MAINHRRGKIGDFDPNKMTTAEWAFPDDGTARYCVAPGNVKTVATKEELQEILTSSPEAYQALLQLINNLEDNPSELTNILNNIVDLQANKIDTDAIANNLVTTEAGLVLDARQGKVLDDKVNTINNNLAGKANMPVYNMAIPQNITAKVVMRATAGAWNCIVSVHAWSATGLGVYLISGYTVGRVYIKELTNNANSSSITVTAGTDYNGFSVINAATPIGLSVLMLGSDAGVAPVITTT